MLGQGKVRSYMGRFTRQHHQEQGTTRLLIWPYLLCLIISLVRSSALASEAPQRATWTTECQTLAQDDYSKTLDAPSHLRHFVVVADAEGAPAHCHVEGSVSPLIQFELDLVPPSRWNGKVLVTFDTPCSPYLKRGYACVPLYRNNIKHQSDDEFIARQLKAGLKDWFDSLRSTHLITLAARAIVERYYAIPISRSYFMGCSAGGDSAMQEAQQFPADFDGLIAGELTPNPAEWAIARAWVAKTLAGEDGRAVLSDTSLGVLHRAALAACDADDGLRDGIISDPTICRVELSGLSCSSIRHADCLTTSELDAARKMYQGPTTSTGFSVTPYRLLAGSEPAWKSIAKSLDGLSTEFTFTFYGSIPQLTPRNLDLDRDYRRVGLGAQLSLSPDMRELARMGRKVIAYQGGNDTAQTAAGMIDYYRAIEKIVGGREVARNFIRLFVIPGMNHCSNGEGAYAIDYLSYLERWVEQEHAPDSMIGAHINDDYFRSLPINPKTVADRSFVFKGELPVALADYVRVLDLSFPLSAAVPVDFTRPVYPYPAHARYRGSGNPREAENFEEVTPESSHVDAP